MKAWIAGLSISARLFALQVSFIALLTAAAVAWLWADAQADVDTDAAQKTMAVATSIADNPFVVDALSSPDPSAALQPYALTLMGDTSIDFITIMNPDRTRYTHPDPTQIGKPFQGTIAPALAGQSFTETYTGTLGPSVRSVVPVTDAQGTVVGLVSAGVTVSNLSAVLLQRLPLVIGAAVATLLVGALAAWLLSRYLRRVTWGRGPEEMSRMFAYYEGVLHSVREGLVLVDTKGRLVLYNDQAAELLGLRSQPPDAHPLALDAVPIAEPLRALLGSGAVAVDEVYLTDERVLVVNQSVAVSAVSSGPARRLGTVTTLRDHTELQQLSGELRSMRTLSDALRSQTHEFSNRLHTIVALIELGRSDEALEFAAHQLNLGQHLVDQVVTAAVDEPVLAALLLGKSAQAGERRISLVVDIAPELGSTGIAADELVTVIGNLIDNALDAVAEPSPVGAALGAVSGVEGGTTEGRSDRGEADRGTSAGHPRVTVSVRREGGSLVIAVSDTGPGVADPELVFQRGYSTKSTGDTGRGIGLALVGQSVRRLGGTVTVSNAPYPDAPGDRGATFTVVIPIPPSGEER